MHCISHWTALRITVHISVTLYVALLIGLAHCALIDQPASCIAYCTSHRTALHITQLYITLHIGLAHCALIDRAGALHSTALGKRPVTGSCKKSATSTPRHHWRLTSWMINFIFHHFCISMPKPLESGALGRRRDFGQVLATRPNLYL